jgi:hypothetical protein
MAQECALLAKELQRHSLAISKSGLDAERCTQVEATRAIGFEHLYWL